MTENPVITFNPEDWNGTISQLMNLAAILLSPEDREAIGKNPEWDRPNYFLTDDEDDDESYFTVSLNYPLEEGETGPKNQVYKACQPEEKAITDKKHPEGLLPPGVLQFRPDLVRPCSICWTVKAYPGLDLYFKVIRPPLSILMVSSQSFTHLPFSSR